jgi:hypothetical protein
MLLLLPLLLLLITLLSLAASNLTTRTFRSNWLLALSGAALAWVGLLFLRLRLPLALSFEGWWAGEGLAFTSGWQLDSAEWILSFTLLGLLVAGLLREVREAMSANWLSWAPGLALAAAGLLATLSADLLAFVFASALLDGIGFILQMGPEQDATERRNALLVLADRMVGTLVLLAAWALTDALPVSANMLMLLGLGLRLRIFRPAGFEQNNAQRADTALLLRLVPIAPALKLLAHAQAVPDSFAILFCLVAFVPALIAAFRWLNAKDAAQGQVYWLQSLAALALAAGILGRSGAVIGFGLLLFFGDAFFALLGLGGRFKKVLIALSAILLLPLPLTASLPSLELYAAPVSFVAYLFLPVQAMLVLGWLRHASRGRLSVQPAEPWVRSIQTVSVVLLPVMYVLFGLGLAPNVADTSNALWAAAVVPALGIIFWIASRSKRPLLPSRYKEVAQRILPSAERFASMGRLILQVINWPLRVASRLLEGPAGVLWALLMIALLLSLVAQLGTAS